MSAIVFTITQKLAYTPNVSIQVRGNKIFENLRIIRFDRTNDASTTGNIQYSYSQATIVTNTTEFNAIVNAVNAMPLGGSVSVTLYYVDSGSGYLVSSVVVNGPVYRIRSAAAQAPSALVNNTEDLAGATLAELQKLNQLLAEGLAVLRGPAKSVLSGLPIRDMDTNGEELDGHIS